MLPGDRQIRHGDLTLIFPSYYKLHILNLAQHQDPVYFLLITIFHKHNSILFLPTLKTRQYLLYIKLGLTDLTFETFQIGPVDALFNFRVL